MIGKLVLVKPTDDSLWNANHAERLLKVINAKSEDWSLRLHCPKSIDSAVDWNSKELINREFVCGILAPIDPDAIERSIGESSTKQHLTMARRVLLNLLFRVAVDYRDVIDAKEVKPCLDWPSFRDSSRFRKYALVFYIPREPSEAFLKLWIERLQLPRPIDAPQKLNEHYIGSCGEPRDRRQVSFVRFDDQQNVHLPTALDSPASLFVHAESVASEDSGIRRVIRPLIEYLSGSPESEPTQTEAPSDRLQVVVLGNTEPSRSNGRQFSSNAAERIKAELDTGLPIAIAYRDEPADGSRFGKISNALRSLTPLPLDVWNLTEPASMPEISESDRFFLVWQRREDTGRAGVEEYVNLEVPS